VIRRQACTHSIIHVLSEVGENDGDQTIGMRTFDNFTYSLESGRTIMIRRQACTHSTIHVLPGVAEKDGDQTTGMRAFDNFTYFLQLGRTTEIRGQACSQSVISRTNCSWGGRG